MSAIVPITLPALQRSLSRHIDLYQRKAPHYQAVMLNGLLALWTGHADRLLDVGGGTGVIAQAMAELFPVGTVQTVDLVDRFCRTLSVATQVYDGQSLPFADGSFDAATLNNVLHHVPLHARAGLLREIKRVVKGPLYIKDHQSRSGLDSWRLSLLDAIGNIPFGGMLWARYLGPREWENLADAAGYRIAACTSGCYRGGLFGWLFPNRLEITMRLEPA